MYQPVWIFHLLHLKVNFGKCRMSILADLARMGYNKRSSCASFWKDTKRNWSNAKIIVFDAPHEVEKPYLERLELLHKGNTV